jgi:hypothetical protein
MKILSSLLIAGSLTLSFSSVSKAQDCPARAEIGTQCTEKLSLSVRTKETHNPDIKELSFEPDPGWKIVGHDIVTHGSFGGVGSPTVTKVQKGNRLVTSSEVQTAQQQITNVIASQKSQVNIPDFAKIATDIQYRAQSKLDQMRRYLSNTSTDNAGLRVFLKAEPPACYTSVFGKCVNWGPGRAWNGEVIVKLVYVGTQQDAQTIAQEAINQINQEAAKIAKTKPPVPPAVQPPKDGGGSNGTTTAQAVSMARFLDRIAKSEMRPLGFERPLQPRSGSLEIQGTINQAFRLKTSQGYAFVAVGDDNADDVDLQVLDKNGNVVAQDNDTDESAVVTFAPQQNETYTARVIMFGCKTGKCEYAIGVYRGSRDLKRRPQ